MLLAAQGRLSPFLVGTEVAMLVAYLCVAQQSCPLGKARALHCWSECVCARQRLLGRWHFFLPAGLGTHRRAAWPCYLSLVGE